MQIDSRYTKRHFSVKPFLGYFTYIRESYPEWDLVEMVEAEGLPFEYFSNDENWVSLEWACRFCDRCAAKSSDPKFFFKSGQASMTQAALGLPVYYLVRYMLSVRAMYRKLGDYMCRFNTVLNTRIVESGPGYFTYTIDPIPDGLDQAELIYLDQCMQCYLIENTFGYLEAVPTTKGLPPAQLDIEKNDHPSGMPCYRVTVSFQDTFGLPALCVLAVALGGFAFGLTWLLQPFVGDPWRYWWISMFSGVCAAMIPFVVMFFRLITGLDGVLQATAGSLSAIDDHYTELQRQREHADQLEQLERARTEFFQNVSHELRTPLTLIAGPVESILTQELGPINEMMSEQLSIVRRNTERLHRLIDQLLDLARIDATGIELSLSATNLCDLVRWLGASYESAALYQKIEMTVEVPSTPMPCQVDQERIETVVRNLLSNSLKFTNRGGKICLSLDTLDDQIRIRVKDSGCGIPKEKLGVIFDRFQQVDSSSTRKHEGTGIGLSLAKELVELPEDLSVFAVNSVSTPKLLYSSHSCLRISMPSSRCRSIPGRRPT